ncbi:MAG: flagellar hook assembly protein FlgD [Spirochaetales bacterium]|nr:flagellar hook assembly protein FlgD [Spirochaetales bacterium]
MDISTAISAEDLLSLTSRVDSFNKSLSPNREASRSLGKDDFLKILLTQLTHQDPTKPLEDREFVAQMAQFSTLEQMSNMNGEMAKVLAVLARSQAVTLLGKTVEIVNGDQSITGTVEEVAGTEFPQIRVDGRYYDVSQVVSVTER